MRTTAVFMACLAPALLVSTGVSGQTKFERQAFREIRSGLSRRTNGVRLDARIAVSKDGPRKILVSWTLDYTGKRQPLVILKPSLEIGTGGQTQVLVWAKGTEFSRGSPSVAGKYYQRKEWFLIVPEGEKASGEIVLPLSELKAYYRAHWPEAFDEDNSPELDVQLVHKPWDRGPQYDMDAWTGELYSPVMTIPPQPW